ncbi:MAG TPA: YggT family protein [Mycobacteriales bacterium]|nr:YggT family protein [Mycobacteriales bacterium]
MTIAALVGLYVLYAFLALLIARLIMDYVMMFARTFRPTGFVAALFELTYTVTDPPLRALRRVIPPLRLGNVSVDLSFIVLFIAASVLIDVLITYAH